MNLTRVLRVQRINPHCGCSDKAFYTLFEVNGDKEEVMGSDEFPYKSEVEFQAKLQKLGDFHKATIIIEP
jgi:hypothetical protein